MKKIFKFEIEAGLLYRRSLKNFLNEIKYLYEGKLKYIEYKGLLSSAFYIKTNSLAIYKCIRKICRKLERN